MSPVDVVVKLNSAFFRDLSKLSAADLAAYNAAFNGSGAKYGFQETAIAGSSCERIASGAGSIYRGTLTI